MLDLVDQMRLADGKIIRAIGIGEPDLVFVAEEIGSIYTVINQRANALIHLAEMAWAGGFSPYVRQNVYLVKSRACL